MNPRNQNILVACIASLVIALAIWLYWSRKEDGVRTAAQLQSSAAITSTSTPAKINPAVTPGLTPTKEEIERRQEAQINMAYATPIAVYGEVVDESGNPIEGATVEIGIADRPLQTGTKHIVTTDESGLFSLSGVRGLAFSVTASKHGFYSTDKSNGQRNVVVPASTDLARPTKENPVVLVLRKQGTVVPLTFVSSRQIDVPATGRPLVINLATGQKGQSGLEVASWLGDTNQRPFYWRYQLSVPGGGLIERKGQFDFEAPPDGYQPTAEIDMPSTAQKWTSRGEKEYFAKLPDSRYARFSIRFFPGQRNFVVLESYVNPTPGSRNLEFDPAKTVKSP